MRKARIERDKEMMRLRYEERRTLREIGEIYGLSAERVRQLTGKQDGRNGTSLKRRERNREWSTFIQAHPEMSSLDVARALDKLVDFVRSKRRGMKLITGNTETAKGNVAEIAVSEYLTASGIPNELMKNCSPYDIRLRSGLRIDVKSATHALWPPSAYAPFYRFRLDKGHRGEYADVFALCVHETGDIYFIPASAMTNKMAFINIPAMPKQDHLLSHPSKWDGYRFNVAALTDAIPVELPVSKATVSLLSV